jgi:hypothetical protein
MIACPAVNVRRPAPSVRLTQNQAKVMRNILLIADYVKTAGRA